MLLLNNAALYRHSAAQQYRPPPTMADMLLEQLCNRRSDNEHVNNKSGLRCVFGIFDLQGTFGLLEATYTMDGGWCKHCRSLRV